MQTTTSDFIKNIEYQYIKTYSFQRGGDYDIIESYYQKRSEGIVTKEEKDEYRQMKNVEERRYLTRILDTKGELDKSTILVSDFEKQSISNQQLTSILDIEIKEERLWMCPPTYRDAILFFDFNEKLVGGFNICFECERIESIQGEHVKTDYKVFDLLKAFLISNGHPIK